MKLLFIAIVLLFAGVYLYRRLRPYLFFARRVLGMVRDAQRLGVRERSINSQPPPKQPHEKLVRCVACGTWSPASRAISLRTSNASYCSHACLERSGREDPKQRAGFRRL